MFSIETLTIKRGNDDKKIKKNLSILKYGEVTVAYIWFNLDFTNQSSLFCGLLDMHCTSTLATEEGNALESQKGVTMVQTSKVKLSDHCGCYFRLIFVLLKT